MILRLAVIAVCLARNSDSRTLDVPAAPSEDGKALKIDLNEEHSLTLLQHWMDQAMSGLMAAYASTKLSNAPDHKKNAHERCSKNATNVPDHAKCVVSLIDDERKEMRRKEKLGRRARKIAPRPHPSTGTMHATNSTIKKATRHAKVYRHRTNESKRKIKKQDSYEYYADTKKDEISPEGAGSSDDKEWVGSFKMRAKRSAVVTRSSYTLRSNDESPFAALARSLTQTVRDIKKKPVEKQKNWQQVIEEVQEEARKLKARKVMKKLFTQRLAMIQEKDGEGERMEMNSRRPLAMKEPVLDDFDDADPHALLDLARSALGNMTDDQRVMRQPMDLIREAVRLGVMASGQNVSDFEEKTVKLFSPRLMSVFPEDEETKEVKLLSPSLFSLHNNGTGLEKATNLADGFGLAKGKEREAFLNLIMEAAGVTDAVEYLKDEKIKKASRLGLDEEEMRSPSGQPLYFTRKNVSEMYGDKETRKIDLFEELHRSLSLEQLEEQKTIGFAKLSREQLYRLYGPDSPYANEERLKTLSAIPDEDIPMHLERNIRAMAEMKKFELRKKDIVLSPVINSALVGQSALLSHTIVLLSPVVLTSCVLSPAVLGPFVLSPWVFLPVILSPRVLSPLILNPFIFVPIVLSPLVLHPPILSPGVFNPFVLSPLVLSPLILSPQVFTPVILTPLCLNPLILSPMVGSPLILSPFVLSPVILSSQLLFAVVLSPYALSPLIESKLLLSDVILSPSWLS